MIDEPMSAKQNSTSSEVITASTLEGVMFSKGTKNAGKQPQWQPFETDDLSHAKHVIVIGGGLSGLVAAYTLKQQGIRVTVLESGSRLGGAIQSDQCGEYLCEAGPNSFPSSSSKELMQLIAELRIRPLAASPHAKNRYVALGSTLIPVPMNPIAFLSSPILSLPEKIRILQEISVPKRDGAAPEESVEAFISRRLGEAVHRRMVQPFLTGVYAGDTSRLSAKAVLPALVQWEQDYGSILMGGIKAMLRKMFPDTSAPNFKKRGARPAFQKRGKSALLNFPDGMHQLISSLAKSLGDTSIVLNAKVDSMQRMGDPAGVPESWQITLTNGVRYEADAVIMATPAFKASELLFTVHPDVAQLLNKVEYAPIQLMYQAFNTSDIQRQRKGFGSLRCWERENPAQKAWLGSLWTSSLFPERVPRGTFMLSHFFGGANHPEVLLWDAARCEQEAYAQSQWMLQLKQGARPTFNQLYRWEKAIPQYTIGHVDRMKFTKEALDNAFKGRLVLTGNYLSGINLNKCVTQGQASAETVLRSFAEHPIDFPQEHLQTH